MNMKKGIYSILRVQGRFLEGRDVLARLEG